MYPRQGRIGTAWKGPTTLTRQKQPNGRLQTPVLAPKLLVIVTACPTYNKQAWPSVTVTQPFTVFWSSNLTNKLNTLPFHMPKSSLSREGRGKKLEVQRFNKKANKMERTWTKIWGVQRLELCKPAKKMTAGEFQFLCNHFQQVRHRKWTWEEEEQEL